MDTKDKLIIGMPAGSLANPTRGGNLVDLLAKAGFPAKGYDAGGPTDFTSVNFLFGWDGRPQEFCTQLALNELDIAIAGDDWMQERILEMKMAYGIELAPEKVLSLHRGNINLVGIVDGSFPESTTEEFLTNLIKRKNQITVVTELPYMALNWIQEKLKKIGAPEKFQKWSIQKYKTPAKEDCGIIIYETWGKTEAKLKNGGADIGLEITQSGSALRNYGLKILEWVFSSETGIWISKEGNAQVSSQDGALEAVPHQPVWNYKCREQSDALLQRSFWQRRCYPGIPEGQQPVCRGAYHHPGSGLLPVLHPA